ncbi:uncharacterized protein LOC135309705 [Plodia interpunctella]|uniref:uncharacterized protein LOC135309705 n=1 Tax=Plodia interpunctella TaxID=58824 RepID=UPI003101709A
MDQSLTIFYQNVNRIRTKTTEVYLNILACNYDVVCFTESNLNDSVFDGEIFDGRYNVFRRDRETSLSKKSDGGGVIVAIKKDIDVVRHFDWDSGAEDLWITLFPSHACRIQLCVCYLPPDINSDLLTDFYNNTQSVVLNFDPDDIPLLVGDFNIPSLQWSQSGSILVPGCFSDLKSRLLLETISLCNLSQFSNKYNVNNRLLDLVLSSYNKIKVLDAESVVKIEGHHPPLLVEIPITQPVKALKHNSQIRRNFNKCCYEEIKRELKIIDWVNLFDEGDINKSVDSFYLVVNDLIDKYTPLQRNNRSRFPVWFSSALIKCLQEKNKHHRRYKKYHNPRDYDTFSYLRRRAKRLMEGCYANFVSSTEESLGSNVKQFWTYVNSKRGSSSIPSTMTLDGVSCSDGLGICELFSQYFGSVFEGASSQSSGLDEEVSQHCNTLSEIAIDRDVVLRKLRQLDVNKGAGPDGANSWLSEVMSQVPLILLQVSLKAPTWAHCSS